MTVAFKTGIIASLCNYDFFAVVSEELIQFILELEVEQEDIVKRRKKYLRRIGGKSYLIRFGDELCGFSFAEGAVPKLEGYRLDKSIEVPKGRVAWMPGTSSRRKADKQVVAERRRELKELQGIDGAKRLSDRAGLPCSTMRHNNDRFRLIDPSLACLCGRYIWFMERGDDALKVPDGFERMNVVEFFQLALDAEAEHAKAVRA